MLHPENRAIVSMNISKEALEFLRESYVRTIQEWFDDPDEQFVSWTREEFLEWLIKMMRIGEEIKTPFWKVAKKEATEYEIQRVQKMIASVEPFIES